MSTAAPTHTVVLPGDMWTHVLRTLLQHGEAIAFCRLSATSRSLRALRALHTPLVALVVAGGCHACFRVVDVALERDAQHTYLTVAEPSSDVDDEARDGGALRPLRARVDMFYTRSHGELHLLHSATVALSDRRGTTIVCPLFVVEVGSSASDETAPRLRLLRAGGSSIDVVDVALRSAVRGASRDVIEQRVWSALELHEIAAPPPTRAS